MAHYLMLRLLSEIEQTNEAFKHATYIFVFNSVFPLRVSVRSCTVKQNTPKTNSSQLSEKPRLQFVCERQEVVLQDNYKRK